MRVQVHDILETVTPEWRKPESIGTATPYQSLARFTARLQTAGAERGEALLIVTAHDDIGEAALLLPLVMRSRLGLTLASFAGGKHASFNVPLLRPGVVLSQARIVRPFAEVARLRPNLDLLVLDAMRPAWKSVGNPLIGPSIRPHLAGGLLLAFTRRARRSKVAVDCARRDGEIVNL